MSLRELLYTNSIPHVEDTPLPCLPCIPWLLTTESTLLKDKLTTDVGEPPKTLDFQSLQVLAQVVCFGISGTFDQFVLCCT